MTIFSKLGEKILRSEYVQRHRTKYQEDADYRYQVQENLVFCIATAITLGTVFGALAYMAIKFPADTVDVVDLSQDVDGLHLTADILSNLAFTQERQYFETPEGMFSVEFYGDLNKVF